MSTTENFQLIYETSWRRMTAKFCEILVVSRSGYFRIDIYPLKKSEWNAKQKI